MFIISVLRADLNGDNATIGRQTQKGAEGETHRARLSCFVLSRASREEQEGQYTMIGPTAYVIGTWYDLTFEIINHRGTKEEVMRKDLLLTLCNNARIY